MLELTDANFSQEVLKNKGVVLVDFFADWCGPCHMLEPIFKELEKEYKDKVLFSKMDVDKNQDTTFKYRLSAIPVILMFKGGNLMYTIVGVQTKSILKEKLDQLLVDTNI